MNNNNPHIDKLFSDKLSGYSIEPPAEEWFELDMRLTKNNFLKFSFYHFNIYYVIVFLISALFSVIAGIHYFTTYSDNSLPAGNLPEMDNKTMLHKEKQTTDSAVIIEPYTFADSINNQAANPSSKWNILPEMPDNKIPAKKTIIDINISEKTTFPIVTDTLFSKKDSIGTAKKPLNKNKQLRDTIYIKQEDIIIRDTVIQYKKGRIRKTK